MLDPAGSIITKCGGPSAVAAMLGVHISRVHRWTYPKERGGTGGTVPGKHHQELLNKARAQGIKLTPDDFFLPTTPKRRRAA